MQCPKCKTDSGWFKRQFKMIGFRTYVCFRCNAKVTLRGQLKTTVLVVGVTCLVQWITQLLNLQSLTVRCILVGVCSGLAGGIGARFLLKAELLAE